MAQRGKKRPFPGDADDSADRKQQLDKIYEQITPDKEDKKDSKALVDAILKDMLKSVGEQDGGDIYKKYYVDAGSHPVRAKIGKANEFDVNIPMSIQLENVVRNGYVLYQLREVAQSARHMATSTSSLTTEHELVETTSKNVIAPGYCVVEVKNIKLSADSERKILPDKFEHRFLHSIVNKSRRTVSCIDLLPYDVKSDLHEKLSNYKRTNPSVSLSRSSHGPALTLTIKPQGDVEHSISLDITPTIEYSIKTSQFGWPRSETIKAFGKQLVNDTIAKGTHLVPKKDLFWAISFSRMERELLSGMDSDSGCRKYVYKMLKKYIEDCKRSRGDLPGISSHIVKTQLLWSCEKHADAPSYWNYANRDICLMNTMKELEETLISRKKEDYFNKELDVLNGKNPDVLSKLADFIASKRFELQQM